MTCDDEHFTWALAHYLRTTNTAATTHADRDLTAHSFRAGWEAAHGNPATATRSGAHRLQEGNPR